MILHTDVPTRAQVERLLAARELSSVSIYLATSPFSRGDAERIELKNLAGEASGQLERAGAGRGDIAAVDEELGELVDDDEFWRYQARSLALFLTPTAVTTFRLANHLVNLVEVSDRFHLKPLLRAVTFPNTAFVLALAQQSVRLLEITSDLEPMEVELADLPNDVASAVGKSSIRDRAPSGRVQGSEGQKTRMRQYARQIDQASAAAAQRGRPAVDSRRDRTDRLDLPIGEQLPQPGLDEHPGQSRDHVRCRSRRARARRAR